MIRKLLLSSLIALGAAGGAQADNYYSTNFGDITPEFDTAGTATVGVGAFVYDFFFSASVPYIGSVTVGDLPTVIQNTQKYDITGLSLSLWADNGTVGSKDAADVFLGSFGSGEYISTQTPGAFTPGSYFFEVTGAGAGTSGGRFAYTASAVSAVPEPETYALLFAGLGVVGFVARRRRA
ncbi:MAG: PEP-CTERM sorting domain-containing protein [Burkholderiaceae bacterium]|nr:PEP-CTERM sorting domain-containing protein [Burkholderiaceae bacterium]